MIKKAEMITEVTIKGVQEIKISRDHTVKETKGGEDIAAKVVTEKADIIRETTTIMRVAHNATMNTIRIVHPDRTRVVVKEVDLEERKRILETHTTYVRSTMHQKSFLIQTIGSIIAMTPISF
jgi:hypothetical protein